MVERAVDPSLQSRLARDMIKDRALRFSEAVADESSEISSSKSFWDDFFRVFGRERRRVAHFERLVKILTDNLGEKAGRIDLLWPKVLLVEHKSRGEDLDAAFRQASNYFDGLDEEDIPRFVIVSDFETIRLFDVDRPDAPPKDIPVAKLYKHIDLFSFMYRGTGPAGSSVEVAGDAKETEERQKKAAARLALLYRHLRSKGHSEHELSIFISRIVFCLFADWTGIFPKLFHLCEDLTGILLLYLVFS